jgi:lipoprotein LprG
VLEEAKTDFDETSGLRISLATNELPDGVTGILSAEGVGTHAPAFEGSITVPLMGSSVTVPVVAVDDKVYAELPLTSGYQELDPSDYGAPDPARLMSPGEGFSTLLTETTDLEDQGEERNPDDPEQVLRTINGTVPGSAVENVIPSAEGDFEVSYGFEDGELRTVTLTGAFYPDTKAITYTLTFDDYGTEQDITAP